MAKERRVGQPRGAMHLVSLSTVTWSFLSAGRPRMLTEVWMRTGRPTTFVEPPHSLRSLFMGVWGGGGVAGLPRRGGLMRMLDGGTIGLSGAGGRAGGVIRPGPLACPARWWGRLSGRRLAALMRRAARSLRRRLDRTLPWPDSAALVLSPMWLPWLEVLPFNTVVYDCLDDLSVHAPDPRLRRIYAGWERELIDRCDGAVVTAEILRERLRARRPGLPIALVRNGVDWEPFRPRDAAARPADLPPPGRPIVGLVGALLEWIDWGLIRRAAAGLPDCAFVLVGRHNDAGEAARTAALPNVHLLGPRPHDAVPAYVRAFDVGWVPFRAGPIARAANPVKIYEYLAAGRPVVSTPVADPESFEGLVRVGRTPEEVVGLLREAVAGPPEDADARLDFARANSWERRAEEIVAFVRSVARGGSC